MPAKVQRQQRASRAGIVFPVSRVTAMLKRGQYASRVGEEAAIYLSAVMEYISSEVIELAGNAARDAKVKRITPRQIKLALSNDEEFNAFASRGRVTVAMGGVVPHATTGSKAKSQQF